MITKEFADYVLQEFEFTNFPPDTIVLDVGSGDGRQLHQLQQRGCLAIGIDPNGDCAGIRGKANLLMLRAIAERIPLKSGSCDGLVCKVVVPYTNESMVMHEIGRVLKPGAMARICYHGAGYYLRYLVHPPSWKYQVYSLRTLMNTWFYASTGKRLPSFIGDTLYQSRARLQRYYQQSGLRLISEHPSPGFLTFPVFIYHSIQRM